MTDWPCGRDVLFYALLAFVPQLVLWLHPTAFPFLYPAGDIAQTYWNHWWFDQAISHFQNPYQCPVLFHPYGSPLYMTTFELVDIVATWPFRALGGVIVSYKAALFLNTLWTSVAAHALARRIGIERIGALVVGIVMAHCSYRFMNVQAISLLATGHPLFLLWALAGCVKNPGGRRDGVLLGVATILCVFSNLYYLLFLTLLVPAAALGAWALGGWRPSKDTLRGMAKIAAIAFAVAIVPVAWFYWGTVKNAGYMGMVDEFPVVTKVRNSADLLQLVFPTWLREIVTGVSVPEEPYRMVALPLRAISYAPPLLLVMIAAGWFFARKGVVHSQDERRLSRGVVTSLASFVLVAMLVALGPTVKVWTQVDPADVKVLKTGAPPEWRGVSVPSPMRLVDALPLWNHIRAPGRAGYFFLLGTVLLLATPFERVVKYLQSRAHSSQFGLAPFVPLIVLLGVYAELFGGFYPVEPTRPHPVYEELKFLPGDGAVREFPDRGYYLNGMMMFAQTIHEKPLAAGYLSRDLAGYDRWLETRAWVTMTRDIIDAESSRELSPEERAAFLDSAREDNVQFLIANPAFFFSYDDPYLLHRFLVGNRLARPLDANDEKKMAFELLTNAGDGE